MDKARLIKICEQIALDTENDAKEFDGKPFDGKTVAAYFGNHGAAIKALADIIKELIKNENYYEKYNWRYYKCFGSDKKDCHVIQHTKHLGLQFESRTKKEVLYKLSVFLTKETIGDIMED